MRKYASGTAWRASHGGSCPQFVVSVYGGPNSDIQGPRRDHVYCRLGDRIEHEVRDLVPDTEYTLEVSLQVAGTDSAEGQPLRSRLTAQRLEVRTAAASTCQFAGEDWGRACKDEKNGKDGKDNKICGEEPLTHSSSSSSSSRQGLAGAALLSHLQEGSPRSRQQPPRSQSGDDCSTIAPSEVGDADREIDDAQERPDDAWEAVEDQRSTTGSARQAPREFSTASDVQTIELDEAVTTTAAIQSTQCNLYSMWDCLKLSRISWKRGDRAAQSDPNELVVSEEAQPPAAVEASQRAQCQQPRTRVRRPYRPAFPGTAVDPASVGLELLPAFNESQLQAVIDDRARSHRRANNI
eukprot:TRINITY_DN46067_c0_g1_i1.p1 TRINITY_DN46067_c0_g1~~TRINITY_DN46067_c0_g1_i1.p1  ORF type:complete len:397 (-),score=51.35 TRINITY_DN46067_c0_g1_i1:126-1181(-)